MKLCIILSHILLSIPLIGATVAYQHWFTRKDKISKFLKNYIVHIIVVIILYSLISPIILYFFGVFQEGRALNNSDILGYYGALIGGGVTVLGIYWTFKYESEKSKEEREYERLNAKEERKQEYEKLKEEREIKNKILYDIDEENNSKEFKLVLSELIRNEDRIKEERVRLAKRNEYNERQKRIAEEQKIEAARVRRQKLIEEARLKEQLASTERLKKLQDETVISPINEEEKEEVKKPIPNPLKNKTFDN